MSPFCGKEANDAAAWRDDTRRVEDATTSDSCGPGWGNRDVAVGVCDMAIAVECFPPPLDTLPIGALVRFRAATGSAWTQGFVTNVWYGCEATVTVLLPDGTSRHVFPCEGIDELEVLK
jgi:hypothetical protein